VNHIAESARPTASRFIGYAEAQGRVEGLMLLSTAGAYWPGGIADRRRYPIATLIGSAGKTMLMVRLVPDLLARRAAGGPVPFLTSIASWNPVEQDLRDWLAAQLLIDHPALAGPPADRAEPIRAAALLASGLILPVLDGLDEIPQEVRDPAIGRINDALRPGEQVVVTSRIRQYRDAVRPQEGIEVTVRAAAAIELRRLDVAVVRGYLCDDAAGPVAKARWDPVSAVLGTDAPAGQALSTPLMVGWPPPSTTRGLVSRQGPRAIPRNCATRPWATRTRPNPCCTTRLSLPPTAITPLGGGRRGGQNRGWCFLSVTWSKRSAALT
jgi:hypothetical protein